MGPHPRLARGAPRLILGSTLIAAQWFIAVPQAAYLSLLLASAVSRPLDALHRSEFVT